MLPNTFIIIRRVLRNQMLSTLSVLTPCDAILLWYNMGKNKINQQPQKLTHFWLISAEKWEMG